MSQNVETLSKRDACVDQVQAPEKASVPVIVAVEFSEEDEVVLLWAYDYAEAIGAPLEILHVVHDSVGSPGTYKPDGGDPLEPMLDVARRKLERFLEQVERNNPQASGLGSAMRLCVRGLPAQRILNVAQAHGAGLLVLGSRRRNGLGRLLHGSTASQVARQADLPVTIVKAGGG